MPWAVTGVPVGVADFCTPLRGDGGGSLLGVNRNLIKGLENKYQDH